MRNTIQDRIEHLELFRSCTRQERRTIARLGTVVDIPAGRWLIAAHSVPSQLVVVLDGVLHVEDQRGHTHLVRAGGWVGDEALLDGTVNPATVVTRTDCRLLVYNAREFATLLYLAPSVRLRLYAAVAARRTPTPAPVDWPVEAAPVEPTSTPRAATG